MIEQPFAVDLEEIGQQRQPIPFCEHLQQLAERRLQLQPRGQLLDDALLGRGRHRRMRQRVAQFRMARQQLGKRGEASFHLRGVGLLDGHVQQRAAEPERQR